MNILIVAAHPDDEILGCGGTVARLVREGAKAHTLILGEGLTSRDLVRDAQKHKEGIAALKKKAVAANKAIGVKDVIMYDFPDNRFDSVPLLDIVKVVEGVKAKIKPTVIFTHYRNDLNVDHRVTYDAVVTATRPLAGEKVREIYSFEVLSSTEWNFPLTFSPDVFFDITRSLPGKLKAARCYNSEFKQFPHPRSLKGIELNARYWGMRSGMKCAEAFQCVRSLR